MAPWFDEFRYFSPAERRGIVLLVAGILIVIVLLCFAPFGQKEKEMNPVQQAEGLAFADSIRRADSLRRAPREYQRRDYQRRDSSLRYNQRDYQRDYQRRDYQQRNYQRRDSQSNDSNQRSEPRIYQPDTIYQPPVKFQEVTVIDLNKADTTLLKMIPGIGSGIAGMIVNYRQQLGGFYNISQLEDIRIDYQQLLPWFEVHEEDIIRIPVNQRSVEQLRRHPYLNFYQARALVEYRQRHGAVPNLRVFTLYDEFSAQDFERLNHYLSFE